MSSLPASNRLMCTSCASEDSLAPSVSSLPDSGDADLAANQFKKLDVRPVVKANL